MKRIVWLIHLLAFSGGALAFCGFYVAKADTDLFNRSSKVIIARDGPRTILTMANDFQGDVGEFALVVPIPYAFRPEQIQVASSEIFSRIDGYSAPRLVEYFDGNPCDLAYDRLEDESLRLPSASLGQLEGRDRAQVLGVTIEEQFSVGEYDILILGAEESAGLETWLIENGYRIPVGAREALAPYIDMGMNFFVARVNLDSFEDLGFRQLRPLMMAFESSDFMLPIQLGKINAGGEQDLVVYLLSPRGRVEVANYPTVRMPADVSVPGFVANEFGDVYRAMFATAHERHGREAVLMEYAWDMTWCDPCAEAPLNFEELRQAGVFWLDEGNGLPNVFLTRLHLRHDAATFAEDLVFQVTDDRQNFQGRYVMQHPFQGALTCDQGQAYAEAVVERQWQEALQLAELTGWNMSDIWTRVDVYRPEFQIPPWWQRVFGALGLP